MFISLLEKVIFCRSWDPMGAQSDKTQCAVGWLMAISKLTAECNAASAADNDDDVIKNTQQKTQVCAHIHRICTHAAVPHIHTITRRCVTKCELDSSLHGAVPSIWLTEFSLNFNQLEQLNQTAEWASDVTLHLPVRPVAANANNATPLYSANSDRGAPVRRPKGG